MLLLRKHTLIALAETQRFAQILSLASLFLPKPYQPLALPLTHASAVLLDQLRMRPGMQITLLATFSALAQTLLLPFRQLCLHFLSPSALARSA